MLVYKSEKHRRLIRFSSQEKLTLEKVKEVKATDAT